MTTSNIPTTSSRTSLSPEIQKFLADNPSLHLGGEEDFHAERRHHLEVFGFHALPADKIRPIGEVEFTAIRGPHGTIPIRVFYPKAAPKGEDGAAALIYFHGGGDSAGGNMTAAIALRRRDEGKSNIAGQMLYYPEARVPFDTPAGTENNTGLYLECNGIFSFADHYLPRGVTPAFKYISPGMQSNEYLKGIPPARVFTSGFDPLRDVGVEYASKLEKAGVDVKWRHYENMTHGWLQMTAWSQYATQAVKDSAKDLRDMVGGSK